MSAMSAKVCRGYQGLLRPENAENHGSRLQNHSQGIRGAQEGRKGEHHNPAEAHDERYRRLHGVDEEKEDQERHKPGPCHLGQLHGLPQRIPQVREERRDRPDEEGALSPIPSEGVD